MTSHTSAREEAHIRVLKSNALFLLDNTALSVTLLAQLFKEQVITPEEKNQIETILKLGGNRKGVAELIIQHLVKKDENAFHKFTTALLDDSQSSVADKLESALTLEQLRTA